MKTQKILCAACAAVMTLGMAGAPVVYADTPAAAETFTVNELDPIAKCLSAKIVVIGTDGSERTFETNTEYGEYGVEFISEIGKVDLSEVERVDYIITAEGLADKGVKFDRNIILKYNSGAVGTKYITTLITSDEPSQRFEGVKDIPKIAATLEDPVADCVLTINAMYVEPVNIEKQDISKATVKAANKTYTGKALMPAPKVTLNGQTLAKDKDYTVSYKNNKNCGKATVTVTGKGYFEGSKSGSFIIKPAKAAAKKLTSPKTKTLKLTWKKSSGGVDGYKVQIALNKSFKKSAKTYTIKKASTLSKTVKGMKKGKVYYARVCAYKKVGKTVYKGGWSAVKSVKCK